MSAMVLTAYDGAILGPIGKVLGWIMNVIYDLLYKVSGGAIDNIAVCIVLLTILIYMCLLPFTIKQQKFSKLNQMMQPEIQEIQKKYKGKRDQASMTAMQQETQMVYDKYGVSPTGSCVQMLIQMPILFALYRVFYNVPAYMSTVRGYFDNAVAGIMAQDKFADILTSMKETYKINSVTVDFAAKDAAEVGNYVVDVIYKLPSEGWTELATKFPDAAEEINVLADQVSTMNNFFGLNISDTPWNIITSNFAEHNYFFVVLALLIPIVSYLTQVLNIKLMPQPANANPNDQMARQMKTMNMVMPLMSLFLCFTVPVGLGLYWICSALVRGIQQVTVNKYIQNLDLDEVIRKNQEKLKKKREKMGISENQIRDAAQINTRSIGSKANMNKSFAETEAALEKANEMKSNAKQGSMAAKANLVKDFNERNSRK